MEKSGAKWCRFYLARIEDLGSGDFLKIDCAACSHKALFAPPFWTG
jgi:hypothetical protein